MDVRGALALLLAAWSCCVGWSSRFSYHQRSQLSSRRGACKPVPSSLSLCHGVGYSEMRLPNLLGHEAMKEVLQQAASWVPLLAKRCHPDTKKFLCSLFAPVCISELDNAPMLNCSRFPRGNNLCIPPVGPEEEEERTPTALHREDVVCAACLDTGHGEKEFLENVCTQDFALKMSIKSVSGVGGDLKVVPELRSRAVYKPGDWSEEELRKPVLWLADGEACSCEELATGGPGSVVLAAGKRVAGRLVLSWVRRWQRGEKELKKFSRAVRKLQCWGGPSAVTPSATPSPPSPPHLASQLRDTDPPPMSGPLLPVPPP
ncbi:hypothetical protein JRQ81_019875 [Phrynocephalus forsythii]|uniref:Secreted frizzled-related protein 2 n=1 Tax=Phrynocephalus forsythii TaxID=171643 RepID=A0A9Q1AYD9_9SAUR|nr:hypothetical protein JRQ81_019875 [Phrynocephalus forsythii]